jgi:hypothetical protein
MNYVACCPDLENWIAKPRRKKGSGLLLLLSNRGPRFILEYRNDWGVPIADAVILIEFCPCCGRSSSWTGLLPCGNHAGKMTHRLD